MVDGKMNEILGTFTVPLEGRFKIIRTMETNLGNWICDVVLAATGADLVMINSGTFRSDQVNTYLRQCFCLLNINTNII